MDGEGIKFLAPHLPPRYKKPMPYLLCNYDDMRAISMDGDVDERFSPCSSFKFPLALMGYDSGILTDENTPVWEYKPEYDPHCLMMLDQWKKPYTPAEWMKNSCVWYSQEITKKLGMEKFQGYVDKFGYGNRDLSGGILRAWLTTSLAISPREQVEFIRRMLAGQLPVSQDAVRKTMRLLYAGDIRGGRLFGKTGSGYIDIKAGKQRGWYAGWLEQGPRKIIFAALRDHEGPGYAGLKAREWMTEFLQRQSTNIEAG